METTVITIGMTIFVFSVWCFSIVVRDNDELRKKILEGKKENQDLKIANKELMEANYQLSKKIRTNGKV
jgi:hypothetical protein